jgi:integrase
LKTKACLWLKLVLQMDYFMIHFSRKHGSVVVVLAQTGMRVGELFGLKWKWVNLSDHAVDVDGYRIPAYTILVRENFTAGEWQASPKGKRLRQIPMTSTVWVELPTQREKALEAAADALAFPNRKGGPLDGHNLENRHFKPAAVKLGLPWACLHCLRHTMATMADQAKLTMRERMDVLGHRDERTAMGYAHSDLQRIREKLDEAENFVRHESSSAKVDVVQ